MAKGIKVNDFVKFKYDDVGHAGRVLAKENGMFLVRTSSGMYSVPGVSARKTEEIVLPGDVSYLGKKVLFKKANGETVCGRAVKEIPGGYFVHTNETLYAAPELSLKLAED